MNGLLINGEEVTAAFKTVRDQLIFTNKRVIAIDVQGITGKRKSFSTMPFSKVQYFSIQTPGFAELIPDSELFLKFSSGFTAEIVSMCIGVAIAVIAKINFLARLVDIIEPVLMYELYALTGVALGRGPWFVHDL